MVDPGARLGVDGRLDDDVMLPYLRAQRWFGAHEREVTSASLVDVVRLADDPVLEVALVDVHFEAGAPGLYHLLLRVQATLGLLQGFLGDAVDGWALGTSEVPRAPDTFLSRLHRLGTVIGEMHGVLASDASDPAFAPEDPTPESAGLLTARIDEEIDATFDELGDREELAALVGRRSQAHDLVLATAPSGALGRSIRTDGDLHLGQALRHDPDWMVIDFEGEPTRAAPARRQKAPPLRDVAGMLRSLSYL